MGLLERVVKLEQAAGLAENLLIIRRLVSPGELHREIRTLRCGDERWERIDGEIEEAFVDRVEAELDCRGGRVRVLLAE